MGKIGDTTYQFIVRIQAKFLPYCEKCDDLMGSITLETALVLPIFMMIVISLLSSIEIVNEYIRINEALYQVGKEMAFYYYPYDKLKEIGELSDINDFEDIESFTLSETYLRARLIQNLGNEWIERSMVKGGALGFHLYRSDICKDSNNIDLIVTYKVRPWFSFIGLSEFYLINRCKVKAWTGYEKDNPNNTEVTEEYVYLAENGEVYHLYEDCTHLLLSIKTVSISQAYELRNDEGCIYYPCEYCSKAGNIDDEYVYLTDWGDRYHNNISCTGLKRTVAKVRLSEVSGLGLCKRCSTRLE